MLTYLAPMWEEALKTDTYATDEQREAAREAAGGRHRGRNGAGPFRHRDRGRGQPGQRRQPDRPSLLPVEPVRLRPPGLGLEARLRGHRRGLGPDDLEQRPARGRHHREDDDGLVGGAGELSDAARHRRTSSPPTTTTTPTPPSGSCRTTGAPSTTTRRTAPGWASIAPPSGSNFVAQYFPTLAARYGNIDTVPENLMMWFHHVPWDHRMDSGRIFWDELVYRYQMGVQYVTWMRETWDSLEPLHRRPPLRGGARPSSTIHEADAANWRDTSVNYWKEFSGREMPVDDAPLSASIVVDGKRIGGFDLSAASYTIPVRGRRVAEDHQGQDRRSPRALRDRLPGRRRPGTGRRQGHEARLLRADRQELRVQDGQGHHAEDPEGQRLASWRRSGPTT